MSELIQASLDDNPNNEQIGAWSQSSHILCFQQKITRLHLFIGIPIHEVFVSLYCKKFWRRYVRSFLRQKFNWDQVCRPCESKDK